MGLNVYGILYPPYDAVVLTQPSSDITFTQRGYNWGVINAVNYANIKTNEGATVLFREDDAILITAGGTDYYIVDEKDLIFKTNTLS